MRGLTRNMAVGLAGIALVLQPAAALAGWKIMPKAMPVAVAKSTLTVTPTVDWNKASGRPSPKGEMWTLDGAALDELSFFAGIAPGEALYREPNKKDQPLPKFSAKMLAPDIVQMFEASNRIILKTSLFEIDKLEPAKLAGQDGVKFTYHYTVQGEEVRRKGEARAAIIGGKLYLINFVAPTIHYYDATIDQARAIMDSARV